MPGWALGLVIFFGIVLYIAVAIVAGMWVYDILERPSICKVSFHEHEPAGVLTGLLWPIGVPIFWFWFICKFSRFPRLKEGQWTSPRGGSYS